MDSPLVTYLQLFRYIPDEDKALINDAFQLKHVKEGEELFTSGHVCRTLFFICKGVLRIMAANEKGFAVTHYFLKENQFCTILQSFTKQTPAHEAIQAACNAEILTISRDSLFSLYGKINYLQGLIDQIIQQGLIDKINIRNAYLGQDSTTRYQLFMMRQAEVALRVSLTDVASYLGITPQSLSRIRKNIR